MAENKIIFTDEDGEKEEFYCIEQTTLNGSSYLLVTDDPDEESDESDAYIMKVVSEDGEDSIYEFVEDEKELEALADIFAELLEGEAEIR